MRSDLKRHGNVGNRHAEKPAEKRKAASLNIAMPIALRESIDELARVEGVPPTSWAREKLKEIVEMGGQN